VSWHNGYNLHFFKCDNCKRSNIATRAQWKSDAFNKIKEEGWTENNGLHVCPKCADADLRRKQHADYIEPVGCPDNN
jgi:hypothetical protein